MAYRIEKCKCGDNDWDLIAQRFQCKSCDNKTVVHKFEEGTHNPMDSVYVRKEYRDGSKDEAKAKEMEKKRDNPYGYGRPPNCS